MADKTWTIADLERELERFRAALVAAELRPSTVATYVGRSEIFLRFLVDDYVPRGPVRGVELSHIT